MSGQRFQVNRELDAMFTRASGRLGRDDSAVLVLRIRTRAWQNKRCLSTKAWSAGRMPPRHSGAGVSCIADRCHVYTTHARGSLEKSIVAYVLAWGRRSRRTQAIAILFTDLGVHQLCDLRVLCENMEALTVAWWFRHWPLATTYILDSTRCILGNALVDPD